jgi:hypothetical protein
MDDRPWPYGSWWAPAVLASEGVFVMAGGWLMATEGRLVGKLEWLSWLADDWNGWCSYDASPAAVGDGVLRWALYGWP